MPEVVIYKQISVDTAMLQPGQSGTRFFAPDPRGVDGSTALTALDEKRVIRWLMMYAPFRSLFFRELRLPESAFYRPEVVQPFYASGENEFDLICCPRHRPNLAIALQCKRVKVVVIDEEREKVNRLQAIEGGVVQANKLYEGKLAFHQTYLAIITVVDAAAQHERNVPSRGLRSHSRPTTSRGSHTTFRQIVEFPGRNKLRESVGILFVEIVQPSRISAYKSATVRVCRYRDAEAREQPASITNQVENLMQLDER